ncbi:hypothetical protein Tco_0199488 [Tanacetum coccineum]
MKKEEYDIWAMEMEHYLEYIDNEVWKVIQNGNLLRANIQLEGYGDCIDRSGKPFELGFGCNANSKQLQKASLTPSLLQTTLLGNRGLAGFADEVIYPSLQTNRGFGLIHEIWQHFDDVDIAKRWTSIGRIAMIAIRNKKSIRRQEGEIPNGDIMMERKKRDSLYQQQEAGTASDASDGFSQSNEYLINDCDYYEKKIARGIAEVKRFQLNAGRPRNITEEPGRLELILVGLTCESLKHELDRNLSQAGAWIFDEGFFDEDGIGTKLGLQNTKSERVCVLCRRIKQELVAKGTLRKRQYVFVSRITGDTRDFLSQCCQEDLSNSRLDRKSTTVVVNFFGQRLSHGMKKQTIVATSPTKEYVKLLQIALLTVLWVQNNCWTYVSIHDQILIDNESTICM